MEDVPVNDIVGLALAISRQALSIRNLEYEVQKLRTENQRLRDQLLATMEEPDDPPE